MALQEAGPYKGVTQTECVIIGPGYILNSMGAFSGVVIIPYKESSFQYKIIYLKEGELVHRSMTVNTFIMDQCVLSDTKIYNIAIGYKKML